MLDSDIIKLIINGNTDKYRVLVQKYQDRVFHVCMGYVHNEDDANDLTQETFIKAYLSLNTFKFKSSFATWIYRIAVNICLNYIRKKKGNIIDRIENAIDSVTANHKLQIPDYSNPEEILITEEHKKVIFNEIDRLSPKQKTAFILSKYDELPQKEIAEIMQITEGAVESLIQRAKTNLQKRLKNKINQSNDTTLQMILMCF